MILRVTRLDGLRIIYFTEAGIIGGKIGLNSEGLGLAVNGLVSDKDDWRRLEEPFHVRCWRILNSKTIKQAVNVVIGSKRSCSANFLIAQAYDECGEAVDIEAAPHGETVHHVLRGFFVHTNHFFRPGDLSIYEPLQEERLSTFRRLDRANRLLKQATEEDDVLSVEDLKKILRDHDGPYSICRHPEEGMRKGQRYQTVASIIMDLRSKKLWVAEGPPCRSDYEVLDL